MISGHRDVEHSLRTLLLQAESVLDPEFTHALRTCDAAYVLTAPPTFAPGHTVDTAGWDAAWRTWLGGTFAPLIVPALLAAAAHAHAGRARELIGLDGAFSGSLDAEAAGRSSAAGRKMLSRLAGARGVRWLERFQAAALENSTPGHFAVVYGCQAAFFHLAPRLMLATYAYWEWSVAVATHRQPKQAANERFLSISAPEFRRINQEQLSRFAAHADDFHRALP